jgi:hypothetical protein
METTFQYPTAEQIERNMQAARRLRSETVHALLNSTIARLAAALRTRMPRHFGETSHV